MENTMIREANYTSVFDDSLVCTSKCKYDTDTKTVFDIEIAENAEAADNANSLTDEYVTIDGHNLRDADGITFEY
jgi:hypothetical protein